MSLDGFVRSAGAAMAAARESFGDGSATPQAPTGTGSPATAFGAGAGRAADGFLAESGRLGGHVTVLADHDTGADAELHDALDAAAAGRGRMDAVIAAAVADVHAAGASASTPEGKRALITAISRHLDDTRSTLDTAAADSSTRAASTGAAAAGYDGVGSHTGTTTPATGGAPFALPAAGGPPTGGFPAGGIPLSGLTSMLTALSLGMPSAAAGSGAPAASTAATSTGSPAAAIPLGDVRFDRHDLPGGRAAYRGYIGAALDVMGIEDPAARARWTAGLETALARESGFDPLAVNRSDANAVGTLATDGAPAGASRGGLQTVPATFASNHQPGTSTNVYDPVANIAAAMNYLIGRYHVRRDALNLVSVPQFNPHQNGRGY